MLTIVLIDQERVKAFARTRALVAVLTLVMISGIVVPATATEDVDSGKKLIYFGWGTPTTMYIRDHWQEMEQMPFNGTTVNVPLDREAWLQGEAHTGNSLTWNVFGPERLVWEDFAPSVDDLRSAQWTRFTDNFLPLCILSTAQDQGFSWLDEERWKVIRHNWRLAARFARESGLKGILLDPEQYGVWFLHYATIEETTGKTMAEARAMIRKRGRELGRIACESYPGITILNTAGHTAVSFRVRDPRTDKYGLLPAFLDGFLEGLGPRVYYTDAHRTYGAKEPWEYYQVYYWMFGASMAYTEVPDIYKAKVHPGFGIMPDHFSEKRPWHTDDISQNYFSPDELEASLKTALELTDRYVWMFTQMPRFFPVENLPPEYLEAIRRAVGETE